MRYEPSAKERALCPVVDGVMTMPDGRERCITHSAYVERTVSMASRQEWKCAICTRIMGFPTFDHESGRDSGGSHQDDRLEHPDGRWMNAALCLGCNAEKGSKRFTWVNGKYQPVSAWIEVEVG